jgi:hypothetical protein
VSDSTNHIEREARLRWVPIAEMRVSPLAQRELNTARVNKILNSFDLEQLGTPTVNERGGHFYIIDGQHRVEALKGMGWEDQLVQCWTYVGLSEQEEAEKFLKLNDVLAVHGFAKFKVGVQAGRLEECDIDRIVRAQGLKVSMDGSEGAISAVGTLRRVYQQTGPKNLARALRLVRDAYGDIGLTAVVIDGLALLCHRYDAQLDDERAVSRLSTVNGGLNALLGQAENIRRQTGNQKRHCVAAAAVEILNGGRGGKKLPSWWHTVEVTTGPRLVAS